MGGPKKQDPQNQHVERTLEQRDPIGRFCRHIAGRYSTFACHLEGRRSSINSVSKPSSRLRRLSLLGSSRWAGISSTGPVRKRANRQTASPRKFLLLACCSQ